MPTKVQAGVSLNTNFVRSRLRAVRKISDRVQLSLEAGVDQDLRPVADPNQTTAIYSRFLLSLRPAFNFKAYFGQQVSIDGWTYIVGFKASGLKVLIPWTVRVEDERVREQGWVGMLTAHAAVGGLCLAANYFYSTLN